MFLKGDLGQFFFIGKSASYGLLKYINHVQNIYITLKVVLIPKKLLKNWENKDQITRSIAQIGLGQLHKYY